MFDLIGEVIYLVLLTAGAIIFLDYLFGTDILKPVRTWLKDNTLELICFPAIIVLGTLHQIAHVLDSQVCQDLTTFYVSICWILVWIYHTAYNIFRGITFVRNYSVQKRQPK